MKLINTIEDYRFEEARQACCLDIQETDLKAKKRAVFKMERSGMRVDLGEAAAIRECGGFGDLIVSQDAVRSLVEPRDPVGVRGNASEVTDFKAKKSALSRMQPGKKDRLVAFNTSLKQRPGTWADGPKWRQDLVVSQNGVEFRWDVPDETDVNPITPVERARALSKKRSGIRVAKKMQNLGMQVILQCRSLPHSLIRPRSLSLSLSPLQLTPLHLPCGVHPLTHTQLPKILRH